MTQENSKNLNLPWCITKFSFEIVQALVEFALLNNKVRSFWKFKDFQLLKKCRLFETKTHRYQVATIMTHGHYCLAHAPQFETGLLVIHTENFRFFINRLEISYFGFLKIFPFSRTNSNGTYRAIN